MGYIKHNAIVVIGDVHSRHTQSVHEKAKELFGTLTTELAPSIMNGYTSFMVAPDGSKEGWDESNAYDSKRLELANFIDSLAYGDGSNHIQFAEVSIDEGFEVELERTNKREGEIFEPC